VKSQNLYPLFIAADHREIYCYSGSTCKGKTMQIDGNANFGPQKSHVSHIFLVEGG